MHIRVVTVFLAATLALAGCVGSPAPTPTPTESATSAPEPSPTPTPTPTQMPTPAATATPVDPTAYATQRDDAWGPGVDFDSADGNVHCGVWASRRANTLDALVTGAYAGCRPNGLLVTYETDPSSWFDGNAGCRGGQLVVGRPAEPVCNNGQAFVGEHPTEGPVGTLPVGSSIAYAGFTCTSPDESTIECVRDADGVGFTIGLTAYRYF